MCRSLNSYPDLSIFTFYKFNSCFLTYANTTKIRPKHQDSQVGGGQLDDFSKSHIWTPGFDSPIFCEFKTGFRLKKFEKLILPPQFYESMFFQTILLTGFRAKFENMIIYHHNSTKFGVPQFFDTRNRLKMVLKLCARYLWLNSAILVFSAGFWAIYHYILSFLV